MNKQRLLFVVAVLCLAQLGIITSQQLQEKDSDLNVLRDKLSSASTSVSNLLAGEQDPPQKSTASTTTKGKGSAAHSPSRAISSELTPSLIKDDAKIARPSAAKVAPGATRLAVDAAGKTEAPARDPFVPFFSIRKESESANPFPLTDYDLSELRVAAIVSDAAGNRSASVEARDAKSFIVKVGSKIGRKGGRVESISATTITITEPTQSAPGELSAVTKELSLKTYPTPPSALAQ